MVLPTQPVITCANCGTVYEAEINQVLDVGKDPSARTRLISGQVDIAVCPHCGFQMQVSTPLVYHDPSKELLMVHVPMELNMSQDEQEVMIGRFIRQITDDLPTEMRKGYLLNPRRTFRLQGMIDAVLEAEGITKEMLDERQQKLQLVEQFLQTPPDEMPALVQAHDADLDEEFFSILTVTAETARANGQPQVADQLLAARDAILPYSTYGKEIIEVAQRQDAALEKVQDDLNRLGDQITHENLAALVVRNAEDGDYLQVFASMVRPALDYQFFTILTDLADNDRNKKTRRKARQARDVLLEIIEVLDQQSQQMAEQASAVLESIVASDNIEAALQHHVAAINDMFMAVLNAAMQEAQQQQNMTRLQTLQEIQQAVNQLILQSSPPEVRFINELIQIEDVVELRLKLVEEAPQHGPRFLEYMQALIQQLEARGDAPMADRLHQIYDEAVKVIQSE